MIGILNSMVFNYLFHNSNIYKIIKLTKGNASLHCEEVRHSNLLFGLRLLHYMTFRSQWRNTLWKRFNTELHKKARHGRAAFLLESNTKCYEL